MTTNGSGIWAVIPVKEIAEAKQRLSTGVPPHLRQELVLTMFEDVLTAVSRSRGLSGVAVVTVDAEATKLAQFHGARILTADARGGHTAAVAAAARQLNAEGIGGMVQLPADVPLATPEEISFVLSMHRSAPSFTIVPSHDDFGSNAIVVSPPTAVPLAFGDDSFFPHLKTTRLCGIDPLIVRLPGIGRDIDIPEDLAVFARSQSTTHTQAFLDRHGFPHWGRSTSADNQAKHTDNQARHTR